MRSIHIRPPEAEHRLVAGHWEGDLLRGARNLWCIGTLVERSTRLVLLAKMDNASAALAVQGFSKQLQRIQRSMRKTMTYDQGKEMVDHRQITARTGVEVYFADPCSPWQRIAIENTNLLLRQYFPKGTDLRSISQQQMDEVAMSLNTRPRKVLDYDMPIERYAKLCPNSPLVHFAKNHKVTKNIESILGVALDL